MSYILDALKKSEQQRGQGKIPDVQTVHSSSLNYRDDKKAFWPYILIAAILLNLVAIVYFIIDKNSENVLTDVESTETMTGNVVPLKSAKNITTHKEINSIENSTNTLEKVEVDDKLLMTSLPVQTTAPSRNATTKIKQTTSPVAASQTDAPQTDTQQDIVEYYDLPESLQQKIPTISISAHIYSSNPLQRSIVINNNFSEEGDYVFDELILLEITADGATFDYDGIRFHYGVISGWQ